MLNFFRLGGSKKTETTDIVLDQSTKPTSRFDIPGQVTGTLKQTINDLSQQPPECLVLLCQELEDLMKAFEEKATLKDLENERLEYFLQMCRNNLSILTNSLDTKDLEYVSKLELIDSWEQFRGELEEKGVHLKTAQTLYDKMDNNIESQDKVWLLSRLEEEIIGPIRKNQAVVLNKDTVTNLLKLAAKVQQQGIKIPSDAPEDSSETLKKFLQNLRNGKPVNHELLEKTYEVYNLCRSRVTGLLPKMSHIVIGEIFPAAKELFGDYVVPKTEELFNERVIPKIQEAIRAALFSEKQGGLSSAKKDQIYSLKQSLQQGPIEDEIRVPPNVNEVVCDQWKQVKTALREWIFMSMTLPGSDFTTFTNLRAELEGDLGRDYRPDEEQFYDKIRQRCGTSRKERVLFKVRAWQARWVIGRLDTALHQLQEDITFFQNSNETARLNLIFSLLIGPIINHLTAFQGKAPRIDDFSQDLGLSLEKVFAEMSVGGRTHQFAANNISSFLIRRYLPQLISLAPTVSFQPQEQNSGIKKRISALISGTLALCFYLILRPCDAVLNAVAHRALRVVVQRKVRSFAANTRGFNAILKSSSYSKSLADVVLKQLRKFTTQPPQEDPKAPAPIRSPSYQEPLKQLFHLLFSSIPLQRALVAPQMLEQYKETTSLVGIEARYIAPLLADFIAPVAAKGLLRALEGICADQGNLGEHVWKILTPVLQSLKEEEPLKKISEVEAVTTEEGLVSALQDASSLIIHKIAAQALDTTDRLKTDVNSSIRTLRTRFRTFQGHMKDLSLETLDTCLSRWQSVTQEAARLNKLIEGSKKEEGIEPSIKLLLEISTASKNLYLQFKAMETFTTQRKAMRTAADLVSRFAMTFADTTLTAQQQHKTLSRLLNELLPVEQHAQDIVALIKKQCNSLKEATAPAHLGNIADLLTVWSHAVKYQLNQEEEHQAIIAAIEVVHKASDILSNDELPLQEQKETVQRLLKALQSLRPPQKDCVEAVKQQGTILERANDRVDLREFVNILNMWTKAMSQDPMEDEERHAVEAAQKVILEVSAILANRDLSLEEQKEGMKALGEHIDLVDVAGTWRKILEGAQEPLDLGNFVNLLKIWVDATSQRLEHDKTRREMVTAKEKVCQASKTLKNSAPSLQEQRAAVQPLLEAVQRYEDLPSIVEEWSTMLKRAEAPLNVEGLTAILDMWTSNPLDTFLRTTRETLSEAISQIQETAQGLNNPIKELPEVEAELSAPSPMLKMLATRGLPPAQVGLELLLTNYVSTLIEMVGKPYHFNGLLWQVVHAAARMT